MLEPCEVNDVGLQLKEDTAGMGTTAREAVWDAPFNLAVMVTVTSAMRVPAVAVKVAYEIPLGTVTLAGMVSAKLLSDNATMAPPDPAG